MSHPNKDKKVRRNGFGIAAGLEKPYKMEQSHEEMFIRELYSSVPHSGYFGIGLGVMPFKKGQASFNNESLWYKNQYGEITSKN